MALKTYAQAVKLRYREYLPEGGAMDGFGTPIRTREELEAAAHSGAVIEAICQLCDCSAMCLHVELPGGVRGIIPKDEAGFTPAGGEVKDIAVITRVGKPVQFKISEIYENERGEVQ